MMGKGKMGVESDPKDFYRFFKGKDLIIKDYLRMVFGFTVMGGKKGDRGFFRSNRKANGMGPSFNFGKIGI